MDAYLTLLYFSQTEDLWKPSAQHVHGRFSHLESLCGNSHNISNFFIISIFVLEICDIITIILGHYEL